MGYGQFFVGHPFPKNPKQKGQPFFALGRTEHERQNNSGVVVLRFGEVAFEPCRRFDSATTAVAAPTADSVFAQLMADDVTAVTKEPGLATVS